MIPDILPRTEGAYIVGGSVRDFVLDRFPADYDIAVMEHPEKFAERLARKTKGSLVRMGKPGQMVFRVVSYPYMFDISPVNGSCIEADLEQRDFTINAMAYDLFSGKIVDCMESLRDISDKKIRMVSEQAFRNDPLRLLRAYRMGALLGFEIDPQTVSAIRRNAPLIRKPAGERIRSEIFKIFNTPNSYNYISQMADSGLLFEIFPELGRLKGCLQNRYHVYDVFEHTMKAFHYLEMTVNAPDKLKKLGFPSGSPFDETEAMLLKCSVLLHDIGKPSVQSTDTRGNIHFYNHENAGADMMLRISERLKFSTNELRFTEFMIRNHIRTLHLFTAYRRKGLTRKGIARFFMACGDKAPGLLLHAIADNKGKGGDDNERTEAFTEFAKTMILDYFSNFIPEKSKPPLITGKDLINEFGLTPSPIFKIILNLVEEERLAKRISDRQEAMKVVKMFLERRSG
ncbi:HD domain-containing protein [Desulfococcaceae bacterium HSG8]|nr:HD domain-containing protein [Desulfococcaceae bacterium HSG8]